MANEVSYAWSGDVYLADMERERFETILQARNLIVYLVTGTVN